jgi:D-Tyr-tRNAtyr deacylase
VEVDGLAENRIGLGLVVFLGVRQGDTIGQAKSLAASVLKMLLFPDVADAEKEFSSNVQDSSHEILVVSQPSLCARLTQGVPEDMVAMTSPENKTIFEAFVKALQTGYQEEMVAVAPLNPELQVELVSDGCHQYQLDAQDIVTAEPLSPTVPSMIDALRRLSRSGDTLEAARILQTLSMKALQDALNRCDQEYRERFKAALFAAASNFNPRQCQQISEWTGVALNSGGGQRMVKVELGRAADWTGRAAPDTPGAAQAWKGKGGKGKGWKGLRSAPRSVHGIASLDEANRLHGGTGGNFEHGQLMRVTDKSVHFSKAEPDDTPGEKRSQPAGSNFTKRLKGTPTIAPMCPEDADELGDL